MRIPRIARAKGGSSRRSLRSKTDRWFDVADSILTISHWIKRSWDFYLVGAELVRLSKRTEYGLRAVMQLVRMGPRSFVQSRDLAQHEELPNKFLESILLALRRGGFLESKVGSGGGYRLARVPGEINVGDLIRRLEGRLSIKEGAAPAEMSPGKIAVRLINERLTSAMDDVLDKMSLEELMEQIARSGGVQQSMYYI